MKSPKLEVYEIRLNLDNSVNNISPSFKDLFIRKYNCKSDEENIIFKNYFDHFIKKLDSEKFFTDSSNKKAFTAYDTDNEKNSTIIHQATKHIIKGTLQGGKYGAPRQKSSLNNKTEKEEIEINDIILNKFYFLINTPLDSDIGILFIQSYDGETISSQFRKIFIEKLFSHDSKYKKPAIHSYCPEEIKEEFRKGSIVNKFEYKTEILADKLCVKTIDSKTESFTIKIEAVASEGVSRKNYSKYVDSLESIQIGKENISLDTFKSKRAFLKNNETKRSTPFKIGKIADIKPTIYLNDYIEVAETGIPDWAELDRYVLKLLEIIKKEIDRSNDITEC